MIILQVFLLTLIKCVIFKIYNLCFILNHIRLTNFLPVIIYFGCFFSKCRLGKHKLWCLLNCSIIIYITTKQKTIYLKVIKYLMSYFMQSLFVFCSPVQVRIFRVIYIIRNAFILFQSKIGLIKRILFIVISHFFALSPMFYSVIILSCANSHRRFQTI